MDISEKHGTNLSLILLDWEKAFDKISHERLIEALTRTGVPGNLLHLIKLIYKTPTFRVKTNAATSDYKMQNTGIRQGCPLSPYLFIIVMTVLFKDVKQQLNTPKQTEPIDGIKFAEILYADDTFLFGRHTQNLNKLLAKIQEESAYYNLNLNMDKCVNLTLNQKTTSIKYKNGTTVPRHRKTTYLGTMLTDTNDNHAEISNRRAECAATCNRLKIFWKKATTTSKWKIQVFDAIIRAKLLYSLECIQLTAVEQDRIDAFQTKGLRRILGIPPTHIDREWTNEKVRTLASEKQGKPILFFSEMWQKQKIALLGHLLRTNPTDPLHQVTFEGETKMPRVVGKRRTGRPRDQWINETCADAFDEIMQNEYLEFDPTNEEHINIIVSEAQERKTIFQTKQKEANINIFTMPNISLDRSDRSESTSLDSNL